MHESPWANAAKNLPSVPTLDDDGLLRFAGRWVAVTDTQIPVVALIVRNQGRLVRNVELQAAYRSAGGSDTKSALRSLIHRLRVRSAAVGLHLHVVRDRGVILESLDQPESRLGAPARWH